MGDSVKRQYVAIFCNDHVRLYWVSLPRNHLWYGEVVFNRLGKLAQSHLELNDFLLNLGDQSSNCYIRCLSNDRIKRL